MRKIIIFLIASIVVVYGAIGILYLIELGAPDDHLVLEFRLVDDNNIVLETTTQRVPLFFSESTGQNQTRANHTRILGADTFAHRTPTGHQFREWSISEWNNMTLAGGVHIPAGKTQTADRGPVIVVAEWDPRTFTIRFRSLLQGAQAETREVVFGNTLGSDTQHTPSFPNDPAEPANATFLGWFTSRTVGQGVQVHSGTILNAAFVEAWGTRYHAVNIYAQWNVTTPATHYTLTFNANGGQFGALGTTVTRNFPFQQPGNATWRSVAQQLNGGTPTRTGFTFWGWNPCSDGSARRTPGEIQNPVGNPYLDFFNNDIHYLYGPDLEFTLYAVWRPSGHFTVTFNANGGTFSNPTGTTRTQTFNVATPTPAGFPLNGVSVFRNLYDVRPSLSGQSFLGWATTANATTAYIAPGSNQRVQRSNITLFAVWAPVTYYTITFDANGGVFTGGLTTSTQLFPFAAINNATLQSVQQRLNGGVPTRNGFNFWGWNQSQDGSTRRTSGAMVPAHNPYLDFFNNDMHWVYGSNLTVTLYAVWSPANNFTVTFNANGGQFTNPTGPTRTQDFPVANPTPAGIPHGGVSVFQNLANVVPTRAGRTFLGWATTPNATTAYIARGSNQRVQRANITLYAVWS